MYKCLNQDDYGDDQFDDDDDEEEETASINSELIQIYNNLGLGSSFKQQFNQFAGDQPINFIKDLNNNNSNLKAILMEDKFHLNSIASLNSPVSINSPTTSSLSTNQKEDDKDELFLNPLNNHLSFSTNETSSNKADNQSNRTENLDAQKLTFGDQFIIDNRKNMNQNRIKSSILGAVKHLSNKKRQEQSKEQPLDDIDNNNLAINLTINAPIDSPAEQPKAKRCICPLCNQSFTQRNSLNRHIRGHTGMY